VITNLRASEKLEKGRSLYVRTCNAYRLCAGVAGLCPGRSKAETTPYFLTDVRQAGGKMPGYWADERRKEATMRTFTIDTDNNITVFASTEELGDLKEGTQSFANEEELARLAAGWPGSRLVEIWNGLAGVQPIQKFTSRKTAVTRIWKAIQHLGPGGVKQSVTARPRPKGKKAAAGRSRHGAQTTKTDQIIALLQEPSGASLKAIMRATGWQAHSVRGFISGKLGKQMGLKVRSVERDGERVYSLRN
jgi:hypothetical protein